MSDWGCAAAVRRGTWRRWIMLVVKRCSFFILVTLFLCGFSTPLLISKFNYESARQPDLCTRRHVRRLPVNRVNTPSRWHHDSRIEGGTSETKKQPGKRGQSLPGRRQKQLYFISKPSFTFHAHCLASYRLWHSAMHRNVCSRLESV